MIIAIYGIPRSGKDTFIKKLIKNCDNIYHLKGSETLNELSFQLYKCNFKELDESKQELMRIEFVRRAKELEKDYKLVIVDGHYSFPSNNGYKVVFTRDDLELYDVFYYLKRNGKEITRNFYSDSKRGYFEYLTSADKSEDWITFEIDKMQQEVESADKDFIVLDSDEQQSVDFVKNFSNTSRQIALTIVNSINKETNNKKIVLTDLDKTISINDPTNDFIANSGLDIFIPKTIFKSDCYTQYQFYVFHKYLFEARNYNESIKYSSERLELNRYLMCDLINLQADCSIFGLTTGMADIWRCKNNQLKLLNNIYGCCDAYPITITPLVKKIVAKYLSKDYKVMAIGDSIIDLPMINESNKRYFISMEKLDKRLIEAYKNGRVKVKIFQPSYSKLKYSFAIEEDTVKW